MWKVPYQKGKLSVKAYDKSKLVAQAERITAGNPAKIRLIPDRSNIKANKDDLSFITVEVTDEKGNICPNASNNIHLKVLVLLLLLAMVMQLVILLSNPIKESIPRKVFIGN